MPHWLIKCAAQRAISWLPNSHWWNEQFQKRVTHSLDLTPGRFEARLRYAQRHLDQFHAAQPGRTGGFNMLDLGTGWFPTVPVCLWLAGGEKLWTYDIGQFINRQRLETMLGMMVQYVQQNRFEALFSYGRPERVAQLGGLWERSKTEDPVGLLASIGIHVRAQDARKTGLEPNSVDLFASTGVLEYIPQTILIEIFEEFRRVARAGAVSSHYINLMDQYHYFDHRISSLNFLRFTEREWRFYNSPLTWLNRLRHPDYHGLFREHGWRVYYDDPVRGPDAELDRVPLAPEFRRYRREELLVLSTWMAAQLESPRTENSCSVS